MPNYQGDDGDNTFDGSSDSETIRGEGGNDHLSGGGGDDSIDGGSGDDVLAGGAGNDSIDGGLGNDVLVGGAGSDSLIGGQGRDFLFGGEENPDVLTLYANPDIRTWEDSFGARPPNPFTHDLPPDTDPDVLSGGSGDVVVAGYNDTIIGNPDYVHWTYIDSPQAVTLADYRRGWVQGSNFADTFTNDIYVLGMGGDDHIITSTEGTKQAYVDGGAGNDLIEITTHDTATNFPIVFGGAGDDTIIEGQPGPWARTGYVDGGDGNDTIYGGGSGGAGNDTIDARGYTAAHLTGDGGADTLFGGSGNDILSGDRDTGFDNGVEIDHLSGGAGDDFIFSGYGDIIDGGEGFDSVAVSYVGATHGIDGDTRVLHQGLPLVDGAGTFQNVERFSDIALTAYNDKMVIGDRAEPAVVRSWDGDDYLIGQLVSVTMYGGNGNDMLVGSAADDVLYGENGNDILMGYLGTDQLWGGQGADRFIMSDMSARARIMDFEHGIDRIDLSALDANSLMAGDEAFNFIGTADFSGVAGELRIGGNSSAGYSLYGDTNGDHLADVVIALGSVSNVTASDFLL